MCIHECETIACERPVDVCMFKMSNEGNAYVADCAATAALRHYGVS